MSTSPIPNEMTARGAPSRQPVSPGLLNAILELSLLYCSLLVATICFMLGLLGISGALSLTALLLCTLLALSWLHFDRGRHPVFLFLGVLTLVQGGRLLAYCFGVESNPLRIRNVTPLPFDLSLSEGAIALFCVALSAICIYAPCRLNYRTVSPPSNVKTKKYLPYLYLLFWLSLPVQLYKNYTYYRVAQENGGYLYFFTNHGAFAGSVPFFVRLVALLAFPVFMAIFVFERRRMHVWIVTVAYLSSSVLVLLLGSRIGTFGLLLTLWYASGIKSGKKARLARIVAFGALLLVAASLFQALREGQDVLSDYTFAPLEFVELQGNSLEVTEVAVKYRDVFSRYSGSYLWNELQDAFIPRDAADYARGKLLGYDVTVFLSPMAFSQGLGTAGSYIAEEYLIGGIAGVFIISLIMGWGLHLLHRLSGNAACLFVIAMLLPDIIAMPRGQLLDWMSVLFRSALYIIVLMAGWQAYRLAAWLKQAPRQIVPETAPTTTRPLPNDDKSIALGS